MSLKLRNSYDLIVVGGGSAGIGAALKAHENGVKHILVVEKEKTLGGILNQCIHDGFGVHLFKKTLTGPEYAYYLTEMLEAKKIDVLYHANVTQISHKKEVTILSGDDVINLKTKAIILTSGSYERGAGAINLPGQRLSGIYTAGQAQLYLNLKGYDLGKDVLIIGSGDIGLIMARRLSLLGLKVHAVSEIMPFSSGLNRNIVQCLEDFNIPLYLSHQVVDVRGKTRVEEVDIAAIDEKRNMIPGTLKTFKVDTLLLAVGLIPYIQLSERLGIKTSKSRGPVVNDLYQTSVSWFFVAGNALHIHDLADDAFFEGEGAGLAAARYLKGELNETVKTLSVKPGYAVSYTLPNYVLYPINSDKLVLKLRVNQNLVNKRLRVMQGDKLIYQKFFPFLIPSELLILSVDRALFSDDDDIVVEVEHE